ncbi:MAG: ATP-binding protein, partial [Rhizorhabdus sp.]
MLRKLRAFQAFAPNKISSPEQENSEYVNLAPTDKADQSGIYSTALMRAAKDPDVFNIALTGPYGSGKSSIIKTFLKQYTKTRFAKKRVLQISLAAFLPEADLAGGHVSKQEIERSILQQMLYGADANDLPLSRFKRIQAPKFWSPFVSLFIIAGSVSFWYLLQQRRAILDGSFFQPFDLTNWIRLGCFAIGFTFVWRLLHQIYVKSFGFSLKSISFKDIEIIPEASREESILNRHLDEIIYFFQSTKYDLVVIEDLDRFNNPDIFVTLREINSLVNANVGVRRHIRFLYALRDNMFSNTDRTKFFEFIVPVIPIINSSNSIDKVLEQGERLSLGTRLDGQFLKEVSRYLNDMRLIRNIFNEYAIYIKNLEADEENVLNPNKLLAILIYKNVLPSDFEELHREKGKLSYILRNQDSMITNAEIVYKSKISEIEQQIGEAEKQVPADLSELCMIYAMALISKIPQGYIFVEFNGNQRIPIQSLWSSEEFEQIVESENILCLTANSQRTRVSLAGFQEELCATRRFADRKRDIQVKSQLFKEKSSKTIRELRSKLATLRTTKFNEIMRMDAKSTEGLFETFGETKELVKFLVLEGFLDDTYYQYTSLFHSGRLSPNDNKFLIQIRAHTNPDPDFQIDNPKEVISAMREDDFVQNFALNVILVDFMLGDENKYRQKIVALLEFISDNFEKCSTFFSAFYSRGKRLPEFTSRLIEAWPGFVSVALASS